MNVWLPTGDEATPSELDLAPFTAALRPLFDAAGVQPPAAPAAFLPDIRDQLAAVLDAAPAALSVVFGVPQPWLVAAARARGIRIIGTATSVAEAAPARRGGGRRDRRHRR